MVSASNILQMDGIEYLKLLTMMVIVSSCYYEKGVFQQSNEHDPKKFPGGYISSLIQTPTCFKSASGRCIDLILTNCKHGCFSSKTFETGFSDFHYMVYANLKTTFTRLLPRVVRFRTYRSFSEHIVRNCQNVNQIDMKILEQYM